MSRRRTGRTGALLVVLALAVTGCSEGTQAGAEELGDRQLRIATTTNFITDTVQQIAGDRSLRLIEMVTFTVIIVMLLLVYRSIVTAAINTGKDVPAIVYMSIPSTSKQLLPDVNTIIKQLKVTPTS